MDHHTADHSAADHSAVDHSAVDRSAVESDLQIRVQDYVRDLARRSTGHLRVGPFTLRHHPEWAIPQANYAVPDRDCAPTPAELDALVDAFRGLDRVPALEFLPAAAPALEPALLAAGFTVDRRAPLMVCTPGTLTAPGHVGGVSFADPRSDEDVLDAARVQHHAFGGSGEPEPGAVDWLREAPGRGGVTALALAEGAVAAAGGVSPPVDGLGELVGIAVAEPFRRRGIGAGLTRHLTAEAFARGYQTLWLDPADPDTERIYASVGYVRAGERVDASLTARP
ncbi:GNAT family N-acetyltransferase [Streptomyces sp. NPDC050504]|uniref:GNAT family N-acetyltransferase n=1 Tax=Streptomyces sp. NPDC050504 TaxID=3365618 RepID=UPI00378B602E